MTVAYDRFNKELNMAYFQGKLILGIVACTTFLGALPTSPTVVSGTNVTFDNSTMGVLTVSSDSPTTIVEWDSFSVANGEVVVFNLPSTDSTILNRVTGAVPSAIYGYVYASPDTQGLGTVYLVNTSGISKGPVATVVTNGFLASTLDVPNGDFLAGGAMTFTDSTQQTINNNGSIVTDMSDAILLGYQVVHAGNITAYQGSASIGAGAEIVVQPANPQRLTIVQGATGSAATGVTLATGSYINAYQAEIKADGNLYTTAIDHEGRLKITGTDTNPPMSFLTQPAALPISMPLSPAKTAMAPAAQLPCSEIQSSSIIAQRSPAQALAAEVKFLLAGVSTDREHPTILKTPLCNWVRCSFQTQQRQETVDKRLFGQIMLPLFMVPSSPAAELTPEMAAPSKSAELISDQSRQH